MIDLTEEKIIIAIASIIIPNVLNSPALGTLLQYRSHSIPLLIAEII